MVDPFIKELGILLINSCFSTIKVLLEGKYITVDNILQSVYVSHIVNNKELFHMVEQFITPNMATSILNEMVFHKKIDKDHWHKLLEIGGKIRSHNLHFLKDENLFQNYIQNYYVPFDLENKLIFAYELPFCVKYQIDWFINECTNSQDDTDSLVKILLNIGNTTQIILNISLFSKLFHVSM